jgi:hypothetical protein
VYYDPSPLLPITLLVLLILPPPPCVIGSLCTGELVSGALSSEAGGKVSRKRPIQVRVSGFGFRVNILKGGGKVLRKRRIQVGECVGE